MTPLERKQLERDRRKAGLVLYAEWIPIDKLPEVKAAVKAIANEPLDSK